MPAKIRINNLTQLDNQIRQAMAAGGTGCSLNHLDVSEMTTFYKVFFNASKFNGDISKWNVGNARDMTGMFQDSAFEGDISQWNVSNVTSMKNMFADSRFNGDIANWDVGSVTDTTRMFENCPFNGDLSRWNTSRVVCMRQMFEWSPFNGDISQWNTSSVLDAQIMFHSSGFARDISAWNLSPQAKTLFMFAKNPKGRAAQTPTEWVVRAFLTDLIKDGYTCDPSLSLGQAMSEYHRLSAALGFDPNDMPRDVLNLHHALQTREPSYPVDRLLETN